jgi:hypothetical protein
MLEVGLKSAPCMSKIPLDSSRSGSSYQFLTGLQLTTEKPGCSAMKRFLHRKLNHPFPLSAVGYKIANVGSFKNTSGKL